MKTARTNHQNAEHCFQQLKPFKISQMITFKQNQVTI